ncbi:MAG TPA: SHD1 domain-containing protein [Pirellulaceae bacterium]|nr:SHD1 domain-containing protein [Pirellulaceae bacterium]
MFAFTLRCLLIVGLMFAPVASFAQANKGKLPKLKPGDKVIVDWLGEQVGEFVEYTGTGWLRVKVKGATGAEQTPVFPPDSVRLPPKGATRPAPGAELRTWTDTTGSYKTEATFVRIGEDGRVELKKANGTVAHVPLDKLSPADQELARKLAAAANAGSDPNDPFATDGDAGTPAEPMPAAPASHTDTQNPANLKVTEPDWAGASDVLLDDSVREGGLTPDPEPASALALASRGIPLSKIQGKGPQGGFFEHAKSMAIAPATAQAVVALVDESPGTERTTRLERVDLATGKSLGSAELKGNSVPMDADPMGQFLVARSDNFHIGTHGRVDLFDVTAREPKHVISWLPYGDRDWPQRDVHFAAFADRDHVCTVDGTGKLTMWNAGQAKALYSVATFQGSAPATSGTGKYLAVLATNGVFVLDAASGNPLARFNAQPGYFPRLSFRPDGQQLACVSNSLVQVWDVQSGQLVNEVFFPTPFQVNTIAWPSDGYMLLNGSSLVDLARRIVLCQYTGGSEFGAVFGGRQLFVVKDASHNSGVVHTPLPHAGAQKLAATLNADALLAIKPGAEVSVRIAAALTPQEQQQVYDALVKKLTENGLKVVQNSGLILHATTEQGKTETVEYRTIGRGFGTESATVTQQIQKLTFTENGKTLWQASQVKGAPFFLHTRGKDLNTAIAEQTKPDVLFYTNTLLPRHLARPGPEANGAYQTAKVTAAGVQ